MLQHPNHVQRVALFLSAMRHHADYLRERGFRVVYQHLEDDDGAQSLEAFLEAQLAEHQPERVVLTEPGRYDLEQAVRTVRRRLPDAEIQLDAGAAESVYVRANRLLGSLFENLIANGVRHNDQDSPVVEVEVEVGGGTDPWTNFIVLRGPLAADPFASYGPDESPRETLVPRGETYDHTFEVPGQYVYVCVPHISQGMMGTIRVE